MQNYIFWLFCLLCPSLNFAQLGVHGDIMLNTSLALAGVDMHLETGILRSQVEQAEVLLLNNAQTRGGDENSHSEVPLRTSNTTAFDFPLGQQWRYLPVRLNPNTAVTAAGQLIAALPNSLGPAPNTTSLVSNYYWNFQEQGEAELEFAWELFQGLAPEEEVILLGFTGQAWEEIPALVQSNSLRSESAIALDRYTAYALGSATLSTALTPAQAITPNGDGINDRWIIENSAAYPNAKIWVFNRWGEEVFYSAGNYQNNWGGTHNQQSTPLPEAAYFYRIDQDNDGTIDLEGWLYITR